MVFNHAMNLFFWLVGFLHVLGCLGGLAFIAVLFWLYYPKRGKLTARHLDLDCEYRCCECVAFNHCEAADTGVSYPCAHFELKKNRP